MRIHRSAAAAGMFLVLAGLNACGDNTSVGTFVVPVPKALAVAAGNGQTGFVTADLDTSLSVSVTDANGLPIIGTPVAWAVTSGGGTLSADTSTTDTFGEASVVWSLGNSPGAQSVTANAAGLPALSATFAATGVMPNFAIESGNNQTAAASDTVTDNPTIIVTDANGDPAQNVRVDFAIASGGGFLSGGDPDSAVAASVITDSKGLAPITWVLGSTLGTQTMTAKVANGTPVTFSAIATVPPVAFNFDASGRTILLAANRAVHVRAPWLGARSL
jgi:Bacterial Ig-like domain (group 1)